MFTKLLFGTLLVSFTCYSQVSLETASSNRILQLHFKQEQLARLNQYAPERLQQVWNYYAQSYTFTSPENPSMDVTYLMNILLFDVSHYEHLRSDTAFVTIPYKANTEITLKPRISWQNEFGIQTSISELASNMPARSFPTWESETFTNADFESYKKMVWAWAQDFPDQYLQLSSDLTYPHVRFVEFVAMDTNRKQAILSEPIYFLID